MFPGIPGAGGYGALFGGGQQQPQGGIASPTQPVPYDTGGGLQPGTPIQGFQNGDLTQAGAAETQFANNAQRYDAPGAASQFWGGAQQAFQGPGMGESYAGAQLGKYRNGTPGVTNNSATQYQRALGAAPDISANMAPYYQNAQRQALEGIDKALAARGMLGSSYSADRAQEAITNLAADQAKAEAQYGLDYSGDRRAWQGLQGQLAGQADNQSEAASRNQLSWMQGLGDLALSGQNAGFNRLNMGGALAGQADSADLSRLNAGMNAAQGAQAAQQGRLGDLFNMYSGLGAQLGGMANQAYNGMFDADQQLMDAQMGMGLGLGAERLNQDYRSQEKIMSDAERIWGMATDVAGSGMMGG